MPRVMAHSVVYPVAHPIFCNFTNYKEKITAYVCRDQALETRAIDVIPLFDTPPQGVLLS